MVVIYRVKVHQENLFWTGDAHRTLFQLTGTQGTSDRVQLADYSVADFELTCPTSLGAILLVSLDASLANNAWFCSKITVTTPEGGTSIFPCHRFVSCSRILVLRNSIAKFVFDDIRPVELEQRLNELADYRKIYRWSFFSDGLPESIRSDDVDSLPLEVHFSVTKATDLLLTVGEALVELGLEGLLCADWPWSSLDQIHQVFSQRKTHSLKMVHSSLQGRASLNEEMQRGNIFLVDYQLLEGLTPNVINRKQQFITSPMILLFSSHQGLVPIAIQLKQTPSEDNPIFLPCDHDYDWLLAKIYVRAADFLDHELRAHFLQTHLLSEVFALATLRNFPMVHPLYKLLIPHFRYTLEIDTLARTLLISDTGTLTKYTAIGGPGTHQFLKRSMAMLTYTSLCLPDDIVGRGLDSIPGFYYRDDGLRLWDIIYRYVEGVVGYYYHGDADVVRDSELQNWINEIVVFGGLTDERKGFPRSFSAVKELAYFITMVIFTASAQHAAVNNGQFDYLGWIPNAPVSLQLPPPTTKGQSSESTLLASLPDINAAVHGLATVYLLSKVPLGGSTEQHFTEKIPLEKLERFRRDLKILGCEIQARNVGLPLPYTYLIPENVEDSVAR
ncbi:polyunsaturated fatty acid lipoxygenase ALOX15B-like [Polymixia lowei]